MTLPGAGRRAKTISDCVSRKEEEGNVSRSRMCRDGWGVVGALGGGGGCLGIYLSSRALLPWIKSKTSPAQLSELEGERIRRSWYR